MLGMQRELQSLKKDRTSLGMSAGTIGREEEKSGDLSTDDAG